MAKTATNRRFWSTAELRELRRRYPHERSADTARALGRSIRSVYSAAAQLGVRKTPEFLSSPAAHPLAGQIGLRHRFVSGHKSWNAGTHFSAGGRSVLTRFKPGNRPQSWLPIGSERVTKDGIRQRKVTDTGYVPRDWKAIHAIVWEEINGPIPAGHIVVFRDGNRENFAPGNLELITRAENMRRNSVHNLPPELVELVQLRGVLQRQINKRERHEKQD